MNTFLIIVGVIVLVAAWAVVAIKGGPKKKRKEEVWPFYAKKPISAPEMILYKKLIAALPERIVLAQVQVSQVLGVNKGFNNAEHNNRISRMSYDFVVCSADGTVLAAIELDDRTHEAPARVIADKKKDRATAAAGIRMIRWNVKSIPSEEVIAAAFVTTPNRTGPIVLPGERPRLVKS